MREYGVLPRRVAVVAPAASGMAASTSRRAPRPPLAGREYSAGGAAATAGVAASSGEGVAGLFQSRGDLGLGERTRADHRGIATAVVGGDGLDTVKTGERLANVV